MTTSITVTPESTSRPRTFTVRRDGDGAIVLTNSKGEDTGYVFPEFKNVGLFVVGPCARRWTSSECREIAAQAVAALA